MDLSVSKIKQNKQVNFKGIKGDFNSKNNQIFRFSTPSYSHNETPYLEIALLAREVNDRGITDTNNYVPVQTLKIPFEEKNTIEIPQDILKDNGIEAFAYRYVFEKEKTYKTREGENIEYRFATDASKRTKIDGEEYNLIETGANFGVTPQGGSMYHAFIDSVGYNPNSIGEKEKNFIRTHANKLGGTIKGMTYLLENGYFDSYKYIISTPDIGADPTSPHKYWPNNQYQCTNMQDFKDFNFELFKRGKGYVADGAFTSQSLQSPLVQHALKWGQQSPFYNMLKVDDKIQLGVLPENEEAIKNVGIRLINSPKARNYDKTKPTLMQFVDDRLLSYNQRHDTKTPISQYGISNPDDHYDSVGYQDTIHPFYFEIDSSEFDKKLGCFGDKNYIMLKDISPEDRKKLFAFEGGNITSRYEAANATYWDGNVDIIKMNLSNPDTSNQDDVEGFEAARNYLFGVATYWTEAIQSDILKRTAALPLWQIKNIAHNFGISSEDYAEIVNNVQNGNSESLVLKQAKSTMDYVREFPLQSIETSPELSAIFSEPDFQSELLKTKVDITAHYVDTVIDSVVPEKYQKNSEYKQYVAKTYANEILKAFYSEAILTDSVNKDGTVNINKLRSEATLKSLLSYRPATVEDEREQVVNKIRKNLPDAVNASREAIEHKIRNELKNVSLEDFKLAESVMLQAKAGLNWRFDAAKDIGDLASVKNDYAKFQDIWNGNNQVDGVQQFWQEFITRIKQYNPGSYIIAEITNFGEFISWNNFDSMMNYDEKLTNTFLSKLRSEIAESDEAEELKEYADVFADTSRSKNERREAFSSAVNMIESRGIKKFSSANEYENNLPWSKEQHFLEQIGATTSSNYDKYFNNISYFVGVNPESAGFDTNKNTGHLWSLKEGTERLLKYTQPNTAILSHTFVDNHDKPRVLHTLPLDMEIYIAGLNLNVQNRKYSNLGGLDDGDSRKSKIIELTGRTDLQNVNPMAATVGLMMTDKLDEATFLSDEEKESLKASLRKLVNGEKNGKFDSRRARAFGFLPYEITVKDLFKGANINDEDKIEAFNKLIMEKPMYLQDKIWQLLTGLIGVPTLYCGTEYGQTGYETYSKNDLVGNRNRILYERKHDGIYSKFYDKINATSALSTDSKLSALRNGFPESLEINYIDGNFEMYPMYRKDEKNSEVISVLTNFGIHQGVYSKDQGYKFGEMLEPKKVGKIEIKNKEKKCPLDDGAELKRMVYSPKDKKYITENVEYTISNGSIVRKDGKEISINDTLAVFYVDKPQISKFIPIYNGAH